MHDEVYSAEERVPLKLRQRYREVVALTDTLCKERLTEEYALLCRKLAAALCRKRPSPIEGGQAASWACGIVQAIGSVNFLFDATQKPHLTAQALCGLFCVSVSSGATRASQLRKMFSLFPLAPQWCLSSRLKDNPLLSMFSVNGFIMAAHGEPGVREVFPIAQEIKHDLSTEVLPPKPEVGPMERAFAGTWQISAMDLWNREELDLIVPAYLQFTENGLGHFQFIAVEGCMDCQYSERNGSPLVEFSWEGEDEGEIRCGRGWACIQPDGTLAGHFYFHCGDHSAFTAQKRRTQHGK